MSPDTPMRLRCRVAKRWRKEHLLEAGEAEVGKVNASSPPYMMGRHPSYLGGVPITRGSI